jgi:hypothetical protein
MFEHKPQPRKQHKPLRPFVETEAEREDLIKKWLTVHKPQGIKFLGLWPEQIGVSKMISSLIESADDELTGNECVEWLRALPLRADMDALETAICVWCWDANFEGLNERERTQKLFDKIMELTRSAKPADRKPHLQFHKQRCPHCGQPLP